MAARLAEKPAGPAPMMITSYALDDRRPPQLSHGIDRLASLFDCVSNEAHATEFAGDEDSGDVGLEIGANIGNVDAALLRAENQRDRVARANLLAGAVTDAMAGLDQFGLSVDQSQNVALGTGADASAAAHTFRRIDFRMQ